MVAIQTDMLPVVCRVCELDDHVYLTGYLVCHAERSLGNGVISDPSDANVSAHVHVPMCLLSPSVIIHTPTPVSNF